MNDSRTPSPAAPRPSQSGSLVGAIILAAGASTRMGRPKQLLPIHGQPLLVRTVEAALAAPVWPVVVVLGANADLIRPALQTFPVIIAENPAWAEGMASSIRTGVATLHQFSRLMNSALLLLCDQPEFSTAAIEKLLAVQRSTGASIVAARYAGHPGAPALFDAKHFAALAGLTGEQGARALLSDPAAPPALVDLPELAFDLDTPEDLARLGQPPA
ncbi:MAG TPA: nucleotidyltransferase family protein [Opitutaceae bacterium]|nr:nucleotidyltransferase family protein [Opitutaceae bacterium]